MINFLTYGLPKTWLYKCLKSPISKVTSTSNMVNGLKHFWNLNESTITRLIDPCEGNSNWKSLSDWYANSQDCLFTHWLWMTSILFLTEAIYCNIFRCHYLRNQKYLLNFFCQFSTFRFNFEHFQKKGGPHRWYIFELTHSEKRA